MRFYETRFPDAYIERLNGWEKGCHAPGISWWKKPTKQELNGPTVIRYWRDWEGAKKEVITQNDYRFNKWQRSRLTYLSLPLYYGGGNRFIEIVKEFPTGFNYALVPMSLAEVHKMEGIVIGKKKKRRKH